MKVKIKNKLQVSWQCQCSVQIPQLVVSAFYTFPTTVHFSSQQRASIVLFRRMLSGAQFAYKLRNPDAHGILCAPKAALNQWLIDVQVWKCQCICFWTGQLLGIACTASIPLESQIRHCFESDYRDVYHNVRTYWSEVKVAQPCPTLCDLMGCSPPGSSVHGIFQARILEWVAISFPRGSSQLRDLTQVSHIAGRCFTAWATREAPIPLEIRLN